jgi:hypothetical protein
MISTSDGGTNAKIISAPASPIRGRSPSTTTTGTAIQSALGAPLL